MKWNAALRLSLREIYTNHRQTNPTENGITPFKWLKLRRLRWWKERLELVAWLAGVAIAFITYLQWRDLRHNFEVNERALIKATVKIPSTLTDQLTPNVEYRNVGKSVAERLYSRAFVEIVPRDQRPIFEKEKMFHSNDIGPIFPGEYVSDELTERERASVDPNAKPLTPSELESLKNGGAYVVVYGAVIYRDQFGMHWTRFCQSRVFKSGVYSVDWCVAYNRLAEGKVASLKPDD
jgi:hypothetical protein